MKSMTCKQLGGACDFVFHAETFEDLAKQSQMHALSMRGQDDQAHIKAMQKMMETMKDPRQMLEWTEARRKEFNALPDN